MLARRAPRPGRRKEEKLQRRDTFLFNMALTSNIDPVADFSASHDTIELDRSIFTAITTLGTLSAAALFTGAAAHPRSATPTSTW